MRERPKSIELPELNGGGERPNTHKYIVITSDDKEQPRGKKPKKVLDGTLDASWLCGSSIQLS